MKRLGDKHLWMLRTLYGKGYAQSSLAEAVRMLEAKRLEAVPARPPKRERPICGARTRKGTPCKRRCYWPKGAKQPAKRCINHGGKSTGPKTVEGKRRAARNIGLEYDEHTGRFYKPT